MNAFSLYFHILISILEFCTGIFLLLLLFGGFKRKILGPTDTRTHKQNKTNVYISETLLRGDVS